MASPGEHVVAVRRLAAAGDVEGLAVRLADLFAHPMTLQGSYGLKLLAPIDDLTPDQRQRLVSCWADRYRALDGGTVRDGDPWYGLLLLACCAGPGLDTDPRGTRRSARSPDWPPGSPSAARSSSSTWPWRRGPRPSA